MGKQMALTAGQIFKEAKWDSIMEHKLMSEYLEVKWEK